MYVYRFVNLMGHSRPKYNSAISTFCWAVANDEEFTVNDRSTELEVLYIDDLVEGMFDLLEGKQQYCEFDGVETVLNENGRYCCVPITHKATLGEIVDLLEEFKSQPISLMMPKCPDGSFAKKLFSLYLTYLPTDRFKYAMKMNCDDRGSFTELVHTVDKVQEIYRQYQMYQEALGEWIHYDLDEDNHLVKKYSGAVIDKVTVNKMTKNILHEGMLLVRKVGAFVQKLGLQNETDFLTDSVGDNLGFQFMVLAAIYMDHGHWAVEFENGDSFYNLLEMCTVLRTVDEEDSADLLETFTLLKNEMEEQGMDIRHIDHYNMLRNYIYSVADIYKIFFDAIQKKLETMVLEIDSLVDKNPDFIATEGKFKGCIFYQTDTDSNSVDVFDPSGNIMADFSIFQSEAIRNYEKTRLGIQAGDPCS